MTQPNADTKISVSCPSGHRLRGGSELVGKQVRCPKCSTAFVFAPTASASETTRPHDSRSVTDTGVMRILGDMPKPVDAPKQASPKIRSMTDTGVMRILGDESDLPSKPEQKAASPLRPCKRCGIAIQDSLAVCPHCSCYIGVMPTFLQQMTSGVNSNSN